MTQSKRNDGNRESVVLTIENSQADAIYSNGTFFHDERTELSRMGESKQDLTRFLLDVHDFTDLIYMSTDKMPTYFCRRGEGPLEVNPVSFFGIFKIGTAQGFGTKIQLESRLSGIHNCKANAVHGNALTILKSRKIRIHNQHCSFVFLDILANSSYR